MSLSMTSPFALLNLRISVCPRRLLAVVAVALSTLLLSQATDATNKKTSFLDSLGNDDFVPTDCTDEYEQCKAWALAGYCEALPEQIRPICRQSCPYACDDGSFYWGEPQDGVNQKGVRSAVSETLEYLHTVVHDDPLYEPVRDRCINKESKCTYWSTIGECKSNSEWMLFHCAAACRNCMDLDVTLRCPWDPDIRWALEDDGGLNAMFERITTDPKWTETYNVTILSQPSEPFHEEDEGWPWVVILDDFLDDAECQGLMEAGQLLGYERSTVESDEESETGEFIHAETDHRTSTTAWCEDECYENPVAQRVSARIADLTGIPSSYSYNFQLLKYEVGQYYRVHHDYIEAYANSPMGPRILTVFMYLNNVQEGGGTRFPDLDITVNSKKGRILIWPSVLNEDLLEWDERTVHEALVVEKGQKFAANAWIHLGDVKAAVEKDCDI